MIYADFHIHIGRSLNGKAVKITASPSLTLPEIIKVSSKVKGLNMIGIVDSHSLGVRRDFQELLCAGMIRPLSGGGYGAGSLTIIPGMEVELKVRHGHAHLLAFFPSMNHLEKHLSAIQPYARNWQLSSQKLYMEIGEWIERVEEAEGIWFPAHAFTPHKGIYGICCDRMRDVLPKLPQALEMGLSSDRRMARGVSELAGTVLLSNSDAHSLLNIAREYNEIRITENSFSELYGFLKEGKDQLIKNFGIHPKMGKYYRTYCPQCAKIIELDPPVGSCPYCKTSQVIMGVLDRVSQITDTEIERDEADPQYVYRVPLGWLPGIGPKKYELLLQRFGSELDVYHQATLDQLIPVLGETAAHTVIKAQEGKLRFSTGGGGIFGKVSDIIR
ncbi:MAG: hypothetical protein GX434_15680 [Peptococcaceae bacterium]|nr:hypothetical protein [Peptococcaceae bacterium]